LIGKVPTDHSIVEMQQNRRSRSENLSGSESSPMRKILRFIEGLWFVILWTENTETDWFDSAWSEIIFGPAHAHKPRDVPRFGVGL
jgi:hypothetical protein